MKEEEGEKRTADRRRGDVSPDDILNLLPVRRHDVVAVFRSHQHGSKAKGRLLQAGALTFNHS